jgi:hypothetical protein
MWNELKKNMQQSPDKRNLQHGGPWRQQNIIFIVLSVEWILCYIHKFKATAQITFLKNGMKGKYVLDFY